MTNVGFENMSQFYHSDISTICFSGAFKITCNPCNGRTQQIAEGGWSCAVASGHSFGLFMSVVSDVALQQQQTRSNGNGRLFVSVDQCTVGEIRVFCPLGVLGVFI